VHKRQITRAIHFALVVGGHEKVEVIYLEWSLVLSKIENKNRNNRNSG